MHLSVILRNHSLLTGSLFSLVKKILTLYFERINQGSQHLITSAAAAFQDLDGCEKLDV